MNPTVAFRVTSEYNWDTTRLYTTGEVAMAYSPNLSDTKWTGKASSNWNNAGNWTAGTPKAGATIEFNAATPSRQPFLQNIADPLSLSGVLFAPNAGSHYLSGPTLRFEGDSPAIACLSASDQFIGNAIDLSADTVVNVAGAGTLNLSGEATGNGSLTKRGDGTLLLTNRAMYWGQTIIESGVLALDVTGQIENSPIENEANFLILGGDHTIMSIAGSGTTQVLAGNLTTSSIVQNTLVIGRTTTNNAQPVPEPGTIVLLAFGLIGATVWLKRRK